MPEKRHKMKDGIVNRSTTSTPRYAFLVRVDGKAKWYSGYRTVKEAKAARDELRAKVNNGTYIERTGTTLGQWLTEWVDAYNGKVTASTREQYGWMLRRYVHGHPIAETPLQKLTSEALLRHWQAMREHGGQGDRPLSARTVRYAHTVVVKALNQAVRNRLIPFNPATDVGAELEASGGSKAKEAWSPETLRAFLATTSGDRWGPLWVFMANTGVRRGEALALRWEDVDLDAGSVLIDRAVSDVGKGPVYGPTKTKRSRSVPLNASAVAALRAWRKTQAAERLQAGPAWVNDTEAGELVFTWEDGRRVAGSYLSKAFAASVKAAKVQTLSLHGLRHTFATNLLRNRVPVHTVSRLLGHQSATMTLNVYAHVIPGDDSSAVDMLDQALNGG